MGFSVRTILLDREGRLFRLPNATFDKMLNQPKRHPLKRFAGQRVRAAGAVVELRNRRPVRVVRLDYWVWQFDSEGVFDAELLDRQAAAVMDTLMAAHRREGESSNVIDARSRFFTRGGKWTPDAQVERAIRDAVLGKTRVGRPW